MIDDVGELIELIETSETKTRRTESIKRDSEANKLTERVDSGLSQSAHRTEAEREEKFQGQSSKVHNRTQKVDSELMTSDQVRNQKMMFTRPRRCDRTRKFEGIWWRWRTNRRWPKYRSKNKSDSMRRWKRPCSERRKRRKGKTKKERERKKGIGECAS